VAISHRRVIPLVWRIEHPSALTRAFVAPAGVNAHSMFRKGRANPQTGANLLTQRQDSKSGSRLPIRQSFRADHLRCNMIIL
jgi:hypothetical protein